VPQLRKFFFGKFLDMNVNINNCPNNNNISFSLLAQISKNKQIKNKIDQNVENVIDCVVSKVHTPKKIKLTNNENTNDVLADVADTFFGVNENIIYDENNIESDCLRLLSSINQSQILHDQNLVDNSLASFIPTNGCLYYIKEFDKSVDLINTCPIDCLLFNFFIAEIQNYFRLYKNIKSIKVLNSCFDLISANNNANT
jgi:RNAse (barnase) inhibitor barstar